jgi:hypothetical protein
MAMVGFVSSADITCNLPSGDVAIASPAGVVVVVGLLVVVVGEVGMIV